MKRDKSNPEKYRDIRTDAEELLRKQPEAHTENLAVEEAGRMLHELRVHQIELEESRATYSDLYDFAPVGYFTFDNEGLIVEANLTGAGQLGVERRLLIKKPFSRFIARDYQDLFYMHRRNVSNTIERQSCEIKIKREDSAEFYAQLESMPAEDPKGNRLCRTSVIDITRRKQAEEAESKLLEELKSIFENLPVGIVYLDNDFRIISSNRFFDDFTGFQEKELKGKICYEILGEYSDDPTKSGPEKICSFCKKDECFKNKRPTVMERPLEDKFIRVTTVPELSEKGEIRRFIEIVEDITESRKAEELLKKAKDELELRVSARTEELSSTVKLLQYEITERKQAEKALRESRNELRAMYDAITDLMTVISPDYRILSANRVVEKQFGKDLVGRVCYEVYQGRNETCPDCPTKKAIETRKPASSFQPETKVSPPVEIDAFPILNDEGEVIAVVEHGKDVTERRRAEERLKESVREKEVLLQEIHHRVKNNMTVISSLLKLQADKVRDKQYREMFNESINRIKTMALIHENLYRSADLSKIVFSDYLKDMAENIYGSYGMDAHKAHLIKELEKITLPLNTSIPCGLIVNELLSNSLKYAFPDDRRGEIRVALRKNDNDEVELMISDNGVGLPMDLDFKNTGSLGLNIVNALVRQIGGNIELHREQGAEFLITFRSDK
jgi:PAS domain S-box-containing protein